MKIIDNELISIENSDIINGVFNVPNGVKIIGTAVFEKNDKIRVINIPDSVEEIGVHAFSSCKNLRKVKLSNRLTKIELSVFSECYKLKSIILPNSITHIAAFAFSDCKSLKKITFSEDLEYIDNFAFNGCNSLINIKLPQNIKKIGSSAFLYCSSLKKINLPDTIYEIGDRCFYGCEKLKQIKLPKKLSKIKENLFYNCLSLKDVYLHDNIEVIEDYAFYNCENLFDLNLPKSLKKIGDHVFKKSGLYSITIPEKVKFIDCNNFSFCYNLSKIKIDSNYCKIICNGKKLELKSSLYCFVDMYTSELENIIINGKKFNLLKNYLEFELFRRKELLDKIYQKMKENNHIYNLSRNDLDIFYDKNNNFKETINYILENLDNEDFDYLKYIDIFDTLFPNTRFVNLPSLAIFSHLNIELAKKYNYKVMQEILKLEIFRNEQAYIPNVISLFGLFEKDKYLYNRLNLMKKIFSLKLIFDEENKNKLEFIDDNYFDSFEEEIYVFDGTIPVDFSYYLREKMTKEEMKIVRKLNKSYGKKINDFVKENYILSKEKYYVIKSDVDINEISSEILNSRVDNQFTYHIIYRLFKNNPNKYDENALNLFIHSYKLILKDEVLQQKFSILLSNFKEYEQFYLLKGENYLNIYDAINYVENEKVKFNNINPGNYEFAVLTKNAGVNHQAIFEKYQVLYEKMKLRKKSYIPRICLNEKIDINNKQYNILMEILRIDDPMALLVGEVNYTNCCQKMHAMGDSCVEHIAENGRVFVTYLIDENNNKILLTESWMWRCNNVIFFDNIEATNYCSRIEKVDDLIAYIYKKMSLEIINFCKNNNDKVDVVAIGEGHNCVQLEKYFDLPVENTIYPKNYVGYTDSDKVYFVIGNNDLIDNTIEENEIYLDERIVENKNYSLITTKDVNDIVKIGNIKEDILYTNDLSEYYNIDISDLNVYLGDDWYFVYSIMNDNVIIHDFKYVKPLFETEKQQNQEIIASLNLLFDLKNNIIISKLKKMELLKIIDLLNNEINYEILCLNINEIVHSDQLVDDYIYSLKLKQKNKIFNYNKKFDKMM